MHKLSSDGTIDDIKQKKLLQDHTEIGFIKTLNDTNQLLKNKCKSSNTVVHRNHKQITLYLYSRCMDINIALTLNPSTLCNFIKIVHTHTKDTMLTTLLKHNWTTIKCIRQAIH